MRGKPLPTHSRHHGLSFACSYGAIWPKELAAYNQPRWPFTYNKVTSANTHRATGPQPKSQVHSSLAVNDLTGKTAQKYQCPACEIAC